ncbi:MAG: DUF2393 domain-containing protein [Gammaproteobacteria bacterium]|nr:DUF2393 domain-containing protein [Gammaproteobacteria bacterium]
MSDKHLLVTIIAVVVTFFGVFFLMLDKKDDKVLVDALTDTEKADKPQPGLRVVMTGCSRVQERTEVSGKVVNTGNVDLKFVTVQSIFKDEHNRVIEKGVISVVRDKPLAPGESITFRGRSTRSNVHKCNAEPLDWWS